MGHQGRKVVLTLEQTNRLMRSAEAGTSHKILARQVGVCIDTIKALLVKARKERRRKLWT